MLRLKALPGCEAHVPARMIHVADEPKRPRSRHAARPRHERRPLLNECVLMPGPHDPRAACVGLGHRRGVYGDPFTPFDDGGPTDTGAAEMFLRRLVRTDDTWSRCCSEAEAAARIRAPGCAPNRRYAPVTERT